ncbi:acetyltransferase [Gloeobacter kilaueensis JS1]|uniref:Acetyltransferase n=2 Tax=Gloeobacter TaxID=33071 RepID=U5QC92_GLOK1|nr:acetyltransferase [Gloeobacter kilaueensis JS1]
MLAGRAQRTLARLQSCGVGVRVLGKLYVSEPEAVAIGNNVHIGDNAYFRTEGGLTIGDNVHMSRNVTIYTTNHNFTGAVLPYDNTDLLKPVTIGKNVWIGMNVSIVSGVQIGDGAIIGMGAVVTRNVPALAIVGNQPIRVLKHRDAEHYEQLEQAREYGGVNGKPLARTNVQQFEPSAADAQMFFVATAEGTSSKMIHNLLTQLPDVTCIHEGRPQLVRLATELAHGLKQKEQVKEELRALYCNSSVFSGYLHGEIDHKLCQLIGVLAELLPAGKIIWLIRDGRNAVASTWTEGWFSCEEAEQIVPVNYNSGNPKLRWISYRLDGAKCGCFSEEEWNRLSTFERNCWYWSYSNREIERQLSSLPASRKAFFRLEELQTQLGNWLTFLGLQQQQDLSLIAPTQGTGAPGWQSWQADQIAAFERQCAGEMDRWYPGWRRGTPWQVGHPSKAEPLPS